MTAPPPPEVLRAYGVSGEPVHLPRGFRGRTWRVGDVGLKPVDLAPESLDWHGRLLERLDGREDFRVAPLLRTRTGEWSHDGWLAWRFEPGHHPERAWERIVATGELFHAALADEPRPAFLDGREDWWATGDRVAFGETGPEAYADVPLLEEVLPRLRPVTAPSALVHGDLTVNVLEHDHLPPLVIDFSPYWRPVGFAAAVVVVDALTWEDGPADLPHRVPQAGPDDLLRALAYRLVTHHLGSDGRWLAHDLARYRRALDAVLAARPGAAAHRDRRAAV